MKTISQIKDKIKRGDLRIAADMLGISPANASEASRRVGSKYHNALVDALHQVIEMREKLINQGLIKH